MTINDDIRKTLWELQDLSYREFQTKLIPTVPSGTVIGVRMPELQKMARRLLGRNDLHEFLTELPHSYFEENNLQAFVIGLISDFDQCMAALECFLPYVDNWATCDSLRPKCFGRNTEKLLPEIKRWLLSEEPYTVRFGIEMLMIWFLDEDFRPECLEIVASVQSEEYYVKMMQAWFFATALVKQYASAVSYLHTKRLSVWVHNKTIQKAVESNRISAQQKIYLQTLKRPKEYDFPIDGNTVP